MYAFEYHYRYLNTQHIKKQKATDAELLYGTLSYESPEQMKEIGELGNYKLLCCSDFLIPHSHESTCQDLICGKSI